ncbi:hypothetical protein ACN28S_53755 [Cystobacter fuscus]
MKKELVSVNEVVRDISSLPDLSDETLETVVGGWSFPPPPRHLCHRQRV